MNNWIGISGWYYSNWKKCFYPNEISQTNWLNYYSEHFNTVELNNSFYALPKAENLKLWYNKTPNNFIFSIKAWNQITHKKKFVNCEDELNIFLKSIETLGDKAGPVLFQLPFSFHKDILLLSNFIKLLPKDYLFTFELRHPSWWDEEVYNLLTANNIAFCIFDLVKLKSPKVVTANFIYARLHGDEKLYASEYTEEAISKIGNWVKSYNLDNYIYFNNTMYNDTAIKNAKQMIKIF